MNSPEKSKSEVKSEKAKELDISDTSYHQTVTQYYSDAVATRMHWLKYITLKYKLSDTDIITFDGKIISKS